MSDKGAYAHGTLPGLDKLFNRDIEKEIIDDMQLPEGKVCSDCRHWKRCSALIDDLEGTETHCDFAPSRFKERMGMNER